MKRVLCIVLDSVGCGNAPDAADYGDAGADTLGHLFEKIPAFSLPNLARLGLYQILNRPDEIEIHPNASWARLTEKSAGKDTTTGHWELMGCSLEKAFATYESFPPELVAELEKRGGVEFIGNIASSGTEILDPTRRGTSADRQADPLHQRRQCASDRGARGGLRAGALVAALQNRAGPAGRARHPHRPGDRATVSGRLPGEFQTHGKPPRLLAHARRDRLEPHASRRRHDPRRGENFRHLRRLGHL